MEPWDSVYNATKWRDACPQSGIGKSSIGFAFETETMSEDCLFLNVWKPAETKQTNLPVMFWIYGGAFENGTIFSMLYDARYIAARGEVIVVCSRHDGLSKDYHVTVNLGIRKLSARSVWISVRWQTLSW